MMDGTIDVESELGKGTKFTVILRHKIADKMYFDKKAYYQRMGKDRRSY